jgi:hypothetical protein
MAYYKAKLKEMMLKNILVKDYLNRKCTRKMSACADFTIGSVETYFDYPN